jgi:hypothetical protein
MLAMNLGLVPFAVIAFLLNAFMVGLASWVVPGFVVDSIGTALLVAFGLAGLNTLFTGLLSINDDDSFYRNVIRYFARRNLPAGERSRPGTVLIQIDGLAEPIVRREIAAGRLPTLARWLESGSHRLVAWETDIPSMTSSGQAGILHGNNAQIPAFRWYEKASHHLMVSNHPEDARVIDQRQSTGHGLLRTDGSSLGNLLAGGAEHCVMTMSALTTASGKLKVRPTDFAGYLLNPYNLMRGVLGIIGEIAVEYWEAWQQRRANVQPRMDRGGAYPFLRAVTCVVMRDATVWSIVADMYSGQLVSYSDLLGYDEVAHHAGPESEDALRVLRSLDARFRWLENAARSAPRPYQFVVLSDHGQSAGATFRQRYGLTLEELVRGLIKDRGTVHMASGSGEGWGHLNAVLTEIVRAEGVAGRGARRLLGQPDDSYVDLGPDHAHREHGSAADVVVCASGNLALIYFTRHADRLSLEFLVAEYPGLIEGLVVHEGIGFLLVHSEARGPVVLGRNGWRRLDPEEINGEDPLAHFPPNTAAHLRRLAGYGNVGDIVVNSLFDPETGRVAAFEELIGCHGGAGGLQTRPFLLFPAAWTDEAPTIVGAEAVHAFLSQFVCADVAAGR